MRLSLFLLSMVVIVFASNSAVAEEKVDDALLTRDQATAACMNGWTGDWINRRDTCSPLKEGISQRAFNYCFKANKKLKSFVSCVQDFPRNTKLDAALFEYCRSSFSGAGRFWSQYRSFVSCVNHVKGRAMNDARREKLMECSRNEDLGQRLSCIELAVTLDPKASGDLSQELAQCKQEKAALTEAIEKLKEVSGRNPAIKKLESSATEIRDSIGGSEAPAELAK